MSRVPKKESAKDRIKAFFRANVGQVVTAAQLQEAARPVSEWARRVRELRDDEGWPIITNNDSAVLKPGEYLLTGEPPERSNAFFQRSGLSQRLRAEVLIRDGYTCRMCGAGAGEIDPETGRKVRLHIKRVSDEIPADADGRSNFGTLCSTCNQGRKDVVNTSPTLIAIKSEIRRANPAAQRSIYEWLKEKFERQPFGRP